MRILNIDRDLTFRAMKPNQFSGIDYAVIRKFKAPVEKFNTESNLQDWARNLLKKYFSMPIKNQKKNIELERKFIINKWKEFLSSKEGVLSPVKMLVAFDAIVKGLKPNNEKIPLPVKEPVLEASFLELENSLNSNKEKPFDFSKIYKENLAKFLLKDFPDDYTGWICIPSQKKDRDGFEDNVEKLKLLSNKNWCTTKTFQAESYLKNGDFQIYFVNGKPELAVRFSGCDIQEIQGERNNTAIPKKYIEELKKHIEDSKYYLNDDVGYIIDLCERGIEV